MEISSLIEALSTPAAYPHAVETVGIQQTHISVVSLAGPYAYKVKKPVNLGFLDFSSLEKRRHFCEEEVRLNRRLAPQVYLGIVPIVETSRGIKVEAEGEPIEWAVKMERLPEEATLERRLEKDALGPDLLQALACQVAVFHKSAERGEQISKFGRFDVVARNARENFKQAAPLVGTTLSQGVFDRLQARTEAMLASQRPLIGSRARRGIPCDTHGDLHLDHVYFLSEKRPPADLIIIDCIEFNERFRFADPVADMAFLVMDLHFHGRPDLAEAFADAYFEAAGDHEGRQLLPFYTAYRAAVRGKVEGFELRETEIPESERQAALSSSSASAHWLLALVQMEEPEQKPCLVLVGGLPGSGKSTLAAGLGERYGFRVIRSDVVRKELAGLSGPGPAASVQGIYTPAWNERTYRECLHRAEAALFEGKKVIVDASFGEERWRREFLQAAARLAVPAIFLLCSADADLVKQRLLHRAGDASDADWSVYRSTVERWEQPSSQTNRAACSISSSNTQEETLSHAVQVLRGRRFL